MCCNLEVDQTRESRPAISPNFFRSLTVPPDRALSLHICSWIACSFLLPHLNTRVWGLKLYMAEFVSLKDGRTRSFEQDHFIARGNYGDIYAVKEKEAPSCELLVLKCITTSARELPDQAEKRAAKIKLTYEALIKLKHENIVKYYDYGKSDNERLRMTSWYSLQEFLPGKWTASWLSNIYVCTVGNVCMSTLKILQKKKSFIFSLWCFLNF